VVRHYRTTDRPGPVLALADQLDRSAAPPETEKPSEPDAARLAAVERLQRFSAAVRADRAFAPALVRQAAEDARQGVEHTAHVWALVAHLAEQSGRLDVIEPALKAAVREGREGVFAPLSRMLAAQRKWEELLTVIDIAESAQDRTVMRKKGKQPVLRGRLYDYDRARPLAELGKATEALAALTRADGNATEPFGVRLQRARVYNLIDRYADSVALCEQLRGQVKSPGQLRDIRVVLSEAYLGQRRPDRAEAELRAALDDDPDDELVLNNLGYNLADQGRNLAEAEQLIRRAIEIDRDERARSGSPDPESGMYLDSLGWVLFRRGRLDEARTALEQAASLPDTTDDPVVWDHLGDVRFRLRDRTAARTAWTKAIELYENTHQGRQFGRLDEVRRKLQQTE
jgi:Tfp pilus assembly protein PilF